MREEITDYLFHQKGPLTNFWTIIVALGAILITFFVTQNHYENKLNDLAQASVKSYSLQTEDFTAVIKQTKGKLDCSGVQDASNLSLCDSVNATR